MKRRRLTIISLLCTLAVSAANDAGPGIGSRFLGGRLKMGPKGAVVLLHGSKTQLNELQERYEAFRKLGLLATAAAGPGSGWIVLDTKSIIVAKYDPSYTFAAILVHQFGWTPPEPAAKSKASNSQRRIGASNSSVAPGAAHRPDARRRAGTEHARIRARRGRLHPDRLEDGGFRCGAGACDRRFLAPRSCT